MMHLVSLLLIPGKGCAAAFESFAMIVAAGEMLPLSAAVEAQSKPKAMTSSPACHVRAIEPHASAINAQHILANSTVCHLVVVMSCTKKVPPSLVL